MLESRLSRSPQEYQVSDTPTSPNRGSNRFPWKSLLASLALTAAGLTVGYVASEALLENSTAMLGIKSLTIGLGGAVGFGVGVFLTSGLNIFRENVASLWGNGELHPKSPAVVSRSWPNPTNAW